MNLNEKLFQIQQEVSVISKDSTNPFFHSKYFDINKLLEILKPELQKAKILLLQPLTNVEGKPAILTTLIDLESEDRLEYIVTIPENTDPQKMGSSITYFRRYALQSLFALQAVDDDANMASDTASEIKTEEIQSMREQLSQGEPLQISDYQDYIENDPSATHELNEVKKTYNRSSEFCGKCGGKMLTSQKGKKYCQNLCWKKKGSLND